MHRLSIIATLFAVVVAAGAISAQSRRTERVVLVTLDGARWQEVFTGLDESLLRAELKNTDPSRSIAYQQFWASTAAERRERLMPYFWRTLARDGALIGNRGRQSAVSVTNRHWFSYPGYSEILTGQAHDVEIKSNDPIRNPFPTVLQFIRRKLSVPASKVATFASWGVFSAIVESVPGDTTVNAGVQKYESPSEPFQTLSVLQNETSVPWADVRHDAYTFRFALDYLQREHPSVLYIAFDETDEWAHDGRYARVLETLHLEDRFIGELWMALQADPFYRDRTTLIVTADHGRGASAEGWRSHGKDVPGSDEIWIAVASPDLVVRGEWHDHPPIFQNQIAATMTALLGLDFSEQNPAAGAPIPLWKGDGKK